MKTLVVTCMLFALLVNVSAAQAQLGQPGQALTNKVSDVVLRVTKVKGLRLVSTVSLRAPSDAFCLDNFGIPCYSPQQVQNAYGLTPIPPEKIALESFDGNDRHLRRLVHHEDLIFSAPFGIRFLQQHRPIPLHR
jgi:hypothetical protein